MEILDIVNTPYGFHCLIVGSVILFALLVFAFGFKSAEEPPFDKLTHDDRRQTGKKRKVKDKKMQSNGHATAVGEGKKSEQKVSTKKEERREEKPLVKEEKSKKEEKKSPKKTALGEAKENKEVKKNEKGVKTTKGKGKENVEQVKNKKNHDEKPKDFDDGEWEQAMSRKDKKNKKATLDEILPQKNEKKKEGKKKMKIGEGLTEKSEVESTEDIKVALKEKSLVVEALAEIGHTAEAEALEASKPKKPKKKKQPSVEAEPEKPPAKKDPSPSSPPKQVSSKPEPVEAPVEPEPSLPVEEPEETWKEAKAPKKVAKKKSRKD